MARPSAYLPLFLVIVCLLGATAPGLQGEPPRARNEQPSKKLPIPGDVFEVGGHTAFLILPKPERRVAGMPWVWYAPTLPGLPGAEETWMFQKFLDAGIAIAGIDVGESYGSPDGRAIFTSFYQLLVDKRRLSRRPCLLARSRGGLMLYNWAVEHPESVGGIVGIYPVCDLRSYPGIDKASGAYGMTPEELAKSLARHNPVDRVEPLARAGVPILHIHGDVDRVVPIESNSAEMARRYRRFGGEMTLKVIKGQGHNMWPGWFQCQELVDSVIAHAKKDGSTRSRGMEGWPRPGRSPEASPSVTRPESTASRWRSSWTATTRASGRWAGITIWRTSSTSRF